MHRIAVLYPPQPDPEAFKAYYVATHIPLARKLPGLLAMRYTFDVQALGGNSPYFCVFEADFSDAAAMGAALSSPEGQAVAADGPNYARVPPVIIHYPANDSV